MLGEKTEEADITADPLILKVGIVKTITPDTKDIGRFVFTMKMRSAPVDCLENVIFKKNLCLSGY